MLIICTSYQFTVKHNKCIVLHQQIKVTYLVIRVIVLQHGINKWQVLVTFTLSSGCNNPLNNAHHNSSMSHELSLLITALIWEALLCMCTCVQPCKGI